MVKTGQGPMRVIRKVFEYYTKKDLDINVETVHQSHGSCLDQATAHICKECQVIVPSKQFQQFAELETYLNKGKSMYSIEIMVDNILIGSEY